MIKKFINRYLDENQLFKYLAILSFSIFGFVFFIKPILDFKREHKETMEYIRTHLPDSLNFTSMDYYTYESLGLENESTDKNLLLSKFDINQDGKEEIFTYEKTNHNSLKILQMDAKKNIYVSLCMVNSSGQDLQTGAFNGISISKSANKGFKDIIFHHPDQSYTILKWNGKCYQAE